MITMIFVPLVLGAIFLARNEVTHSVRMRFIDAPDFPLSYRALPSYGSMVLDPAHWHRWTFAQWERYVEGRKA